MTTRSTIDRLAIILMAALMLVTLLVLLIGDRSLPYVREFSWQNQEIGADNTAFMMRFSRSMDRPKVESQLYITRLPTDQTPSERLPIGQILPGKVSWAGKKMLYTPEKPLPYGNRYQLDLQGAGAANNQGQPTGRIMQPFASQFNVRDRLFAYIGTKGNSQGRLVLNQFGQGSEVLLTPTNLTVIDFRFAPKGAGIVYTAIPSVGRDQNTPLLDSQQIYRVAIDQRQSIGNPAELILDSKKYQNIKFDLAPDGKNIVVQRINRQDPKDVGIWSIGLEPGAIPQKISQGGDFLITPDSAAIAVAEGEGVAITPLAPEVKPWDFLPKFGTVLSFANNGQSAAMVKFNNDFTKSLFLVTNQGVQKELRRINGDFKTAQFSPDGKILYVVTELQPVATTPDPEIKPNVKAASQPAKAASQPVTPPKPEIPQTFLIAIDVNSATTQPILQLPSQSGIILNLSPDGRALMFDQVVTGKKVAGTQTLMTPDGQAIREGVIWLLPLPSSFAGFQEKIRPEQLPVSGFYPQWSP